MNKYHDIQVFLDELKGLLGRTILACSVETNFLDIPYLKTEELLLRGHLEMVRENNYHAASRYGLLNSQTNSIIIRLNKKITGKDALYCK